MGYRVEFQVCGFKQCLATKLEFCRDEEVTHAEVNRCDMNTNFWKNLSQYITHPMKEVYDEKTDTLPAG